MNPLDDQLERLFRAAAQLQSAPAPAASFGLETRAMAAWRSSYVSDHGLWDMTLLLRGLLAAAVIMVVSFWPALNISANPFAEFLQLTDSTVTSDLSP